MDREMGARPGTVGWCRLTLQPKVRATHEGLPVRYGVASGHTLRDR